MSAAIKNIAIDIANQDEWSRVPEQTEFSVTKRRSHPSAPFQYSCSGLLPEVQYSVYLKVEPVLHGTWKYNKGMKKYAFQSDNKVEEPQGPQYLPLSSEQSYFLGKDLMADGVNFDDIYLSKDESHRNSSTFIMRTIVLYRTSVVFYTKDGEQAVFSDPKQEFVATGTLSERYKKTGKKRGAAKEVAVEEPKAKKPVGEQVQDGIREPVGTDGHNGSGQAQQLYQEMGNFVHQNQARRYEEYQDQQRDLEQPQQMGIYEYDPEEEEEEEEGEVYEIYEEDFDGQEQAIVYEEVPLAVREEQNHGLFEEFVLQGEQEFQPILVAGNFQDPVAHMNQVFPVFNHQFQGPARVEEEDHFPAPFSPVVFAHQEHQFQNFADFQPMPVQEDFMLNDHFYGHQGQQHFEPYFPEHGQMNHQVFGVFEEGAEFNGAPQMGC